MNDSFRELRDQMFANLIEKEKENYSNPLESFEVYAARIKEKLHVSTEDYLDHLQQGYGVILSKIASKIKSGEK